MKNVINPLFAHRIRYVPCDALQLKQFGSPECNPPPQKKHTGTFDDIVQKLSKQFNVLQGTKN